MEAVLYIITGVVILAYMLLSIALWSHSFRMKWMATGRYQKMLFIRAILGVCLLIVISVNRFLVGDEAVRGGSPFAFLVLLLVIIALIGSDIAGTKRVDSDILELLEKNKQKGDSSK